MGGTVIGLAVVPALVGALASWVYGREQPGPLLLWSATLQEVALIGLAIRLVQARLHATPDSLGGWLGVDGPLWRWLLYGVVAGFGLLLAETLASALTFIVVAAVRGGAVAARVLSEASDPVVQMVSMVRTPEQRYLLAVVLVGIGPLAEEFWFRGVVYPACRARWGPGWGNMVVSLLFSTLHLNAAAWLALFAVGFILAAVYERTRSLWPGVVAHATLNAAALFGVLSGLGGMDR
ncbi:MAG: CPBP family intramembrane metalloprotease [Limnochordaceae bacterium]|nr:CPBP family intramembrane metalloprotease [Limnochordaceae bacterium]